MSRIRFIFSFKKIILFLTFLMLFILARNITVSIASSYKRARMVDELRSSLSEKKQEQAYLLQKLYVAKTDTFVEDQARTKLGMVQPGEKVVIDERIEAKKAEKIAYAFPIWAKWWRLFFD